MDITLAHTFIAVAQSGSFIAAGKLLHVSQTTVTARIQNLEKQVTCTLLIRNKSGAHLTDNGRRFLPYAHQMVQLWEATRRELPVPSQASDVVTLGCEQSLWNPLLSAWVANIRRNTPGLALRVVVAESTSLNRDIKSGFIDIGLVHLPVYAGNIYVEHVLDEKLVMVTTNSTDQYLYVDWGKDFCEQHDTAFPELARGELYFNFGPAALQYLLKEGGKGYFRTRVVNRHLQAKTLQRVADTPEFSYPVYLLHRHSPSEMVKRCAEQLRCIVSSENHWF